LKVRLLLTVTIYRVGQKMAQVVFVRNSSKLHQIW